MLQLLLAVGLIFLLLLAWVSVQLAARRLAAKHVAYGAEQDAGGACGKPVGCYKIACKHGGN